MIRAVVFDAVWTVMYPSPGVAEVYQSAVARHCNLQLPTDHIRDVVDLAIRKRSTDDGLRTDESTEYRFWNQLVQSLCGDHPGRQACFEDLYHCFQRPENWRCFHDVADSIDGLQRAGVTTAIASNFDQRLHRVLDGLAPISAVPYRFISSEIGWRKPAQSFFRHVCRHLNEDPGNVLFVGDDLKNDVLGARRAGCQSAWIRRGGDCKISQPAPVDTILLTELTHLPALLKHGSSL